MVVDSATTERSSVDEKIETPAAEVRIVAIVIAAIINSSINVIIKMANFIRSNLVTNFDQGCLG